MIPTNFSGSLRYLVEAEPTTLLADLEALAKHSADAQARRGWFIALVFISIGAGIIAASTLSGGLIPGIILGIAGAILFGVLAHLESRQILDERRRKLAKSVVRALACDLPPEGKLELGIDFNNYHHEKYRERTWQVNLYTAAQYRLPWLVIRCKLMNGTRLELWTDHIVSRKERSKTKGRKKIKEDIYEHIRLTVCPAALPDQAEKVWPEYMRTRALPPGTYLHEARVKKNTLYLEVKTQRQVRVTNKGVVESGKDVEKNLANHHTILAPLLGAFDALQACRKGA